jgi:carbon-monoxide dehydrogenase medium subunit
MRPFSYLEPSSVDEALSELAEHGERARLIAGGQSLLLELKDRVRAPGQLISLARLDGLRGWRRADKRLFLGAATTYRQLRDSPPDGPLAGLGEVASRIADLPVQTMATVGGAVCQADPRFDLPVVTTALGAEFVLRSPGGERRVPAGEFFTGPGRTAARPDELLTSLSFPEPPAGCWWAFRKFRIRSMDAALVSVAVAGRTDPGRVLRDVVVVAGACTERPVRVAGVERLLDGAPAGPYLAAEAGDLLASLLDPVPRGWPFPAPEYLRHMSGVLLRRALSEADGGPGAPDGADSNGNGTSSSGGR